jgi:flavin reductase (DIM6/NTAB) family NADH-FMN oxidoreductase RutF
MGLSAEVDLDEQAKKTTLRMIPHGLQIVTVREGETFHGYTSSWMTQSSFSPPYVVLGVRKDSLARKMMAAEKVLAIHFPGREQLELAKTFFKPPEIGEGTLGGTPYRVGEKTGCPILTDTLAHAECRIVHEWDDGDHSVVVAEVLDADVHREGDPLLLADTPWQYGG